MKWKSNWQYIILIIPLFLTPFSSSLPDGLEWVAERLSFADAVTQNSLLMPPLADYTFPGITWDGLSMFLSGILGALLAFILGYGIARFLKGKTIK